MEDTDVTPQLLTVAELAKRLRISRPTAYRLIGSGRLRAYRVGVGGTGAIRVDVRELERLIAPSTTEATTP